MDEIKLYNLIKYIENGTNLHIVVLFFGNYGNKMCELPRNHIIHTAPVCEDIKAQSRYSYKKCVFCRNMAVRKALSTKKPFGGLCINGIYEYTHPIIINDEVAGLIFIGNIMDKDGYDKLRSSVSDEELLNTMETKLMHDDVVTISKLLENHILFLLEKYSHDVASTSPLIANIKNYIYSNLEGADIAHIAKQFHYNKTYLGRLFKKETGMNIKDYINLQRIEKAKHILSTSDEPIISVAYQVGFNNVTYFNRVFKEFTSFSPSQYRCSHKTTEIT